MVKTYAEKYFEARDEIERLEKEIKELKEECDVLLPGHTYIIGNATITIGEINHFHQKIISYNRSRNTYYQKGGHFMTNAELIQKQRDEIKTANSTVVDAFYELKAALRDEAYAFDKANKMVNEDVNLYIELRKDLEEMFVKYSKLYAAVDKQTGHVGF